MSYKTYITDALVCGSRSKSTSDRSYTLFTRDAGMLFATAKSVREERSKQRYALQEFSYVRATLVHGKSGWRVTGAEPIVNAYTIQTTREARALVRNVIRMLRRLIQGETPHETIFDDVRSVLAKVCTENMGAYEEVLTLRMLHMLGYIAPTADLAPILEYPIGDGVASLTMDGCESRMRLIESALRESHL